VVGSFGILRGIIHGRAAGGIKHAQQVESFLDRTFKAMRLFAGQENQAARTNRGVVFTHPDLSGTGKDADDFLVKMKMFRGT
jgi:hypothetical protein